MKKFLTKKIFVVIIFLLLTQNTYAADGLMLFDKETESVSIGQEFSIDVKIFSDEEELILGRAVLTFDPDYLQITRILRNEDIFCDYDDDRQSADNENGVIVIEGYCQSGEDELYKTATDPDVFARIYFRPIIAGSTDIEWEHSGQNVDFKSVLMAEGSPPQNILKFAPSKMTINIQSVNNKTKTPQTNIFGVDNVLIGILLIVIGIASFAVLSMIITLIRYRGVRAYNTIIISDDEDSNRP